MANKTVTVAPSGGDYTTLQAAITGEVAANADLTAAGMDGILTISIQGTWSSADTTAVTVTGFTVDSTHYVRIITDSSNRASTVWSTGKYRLTRGSSGYALTVSNQYTRVEGLQISNTVDNGSCVYSTVANGRLIGCFLDGVTGGGTGIYAEETTGWYIYNNVVVRCGWYGIRMDYAGYIYNNTVMNCGTGIRTGNTVIYLTNNYAGGSTDYDYNSGGANNVWATNYSEDGTGTTTTAAFSISSGAYFTSITGGSENAALQSSSSLVDAGTSLSGTFTDDINGTTRGATWDVGAYEYVGGATTYNVTYDDNGSDSGSVPVDSTDYEEDDTVTVLGNTGSLARSGYTWDGWNTADDGSGTHYDEDDTFSMPASNVTLYAEWGAISGGTSKSSIFGGRIIR